eukprot:CAMPEP_0168560530 /NCGR_PEP_ID=MMETSP0413-20121227/11109_1 /TAXON_ID=136452 /ORGANISM="Filamoeba nolandi, Strain NC-AS-23-1" /LENGTH=310 /DNA_ID=CAMNT_0008591837 /DNA_START=23 /DNA_END=955 /DNA_ORIENTATION=-
MPAKKKTETTEKPAEGAAPAESPKKATKKAAAAKSPKKSADKTIDVPKRLVPASEKRQSKKIERFDEKETPREEKEVVIKKGKGKKLEDIENVASKIKNRPKSDDVLQSVHSICVGGRVSKKTDIKGHLNQFSGVVYDDDFTRKQLEARIDRFHLRVIREVLAFFGQDPDGEREELVGRLTDFLEKPSASDKSYRVGGRKRSRSESRERSRSPSSSKSPKRSKSSSSKSPSRKKRAKKDPNAPKRPLSSYMYFCKDKRDDLDRGMKVTEQAQELARMWKKVSTSEKKKYEEKAKKDKERYEKEMKKYSGK